ncbi:MAG: hypothetical protein Q9222_001180 [Ikaeria aurantiellina]
MTTPHFNPRRRFLNKDTPAGPSFPPSPSHDETHQQSSANLPLKKSSTFHSPTTPPAQDDDPILNIPLLPRRSPTCPKALEDAVAAGGNRIQNIIGAVDRSLSGLETFSNDSQETLRAADCPVPRFMLDAGAGGSDDMDVDSLPSPASPHQTKQHPRRKHHTSDSGIGSTVTGSEESLFRGSASYTQDKTSLHSSVVEIQSGINGAVAPGVTPETASQHALSEYACRHIQKHIISPIIAESSLKDYHPLVRGIPYRVGRKEITCLRDLEKVLLWLAPVSESIALGARSLAHFLLCGVQKWSVSKGVFLRFCQTTIQCLHTTVDFLNEADQCRPGDRPYTNGYFLDLTEQVRQYAAMINASRARMAKGGRMTDEDVTPGERLGLHGGISQTGRPVELVRIKNGQNISLRTGSALDPVSNIADGESDNDPLRSMARRRKTAQAAAKEAQKCRDCEKVFKRPCDLTKHEKTHSRPWKCSEKSCKYYSYGWPTEKERDRHVNDKHSASPCMYRCHFRPCPYESKRESNCKQHMEKAHGWAYVRSKNNGKSKKHSIGKTPSTPQTTTPVLDTSSPEFGDTCSLQYGSVYSVAPSINDSEASLPGQALHTPFMDLESRLSPFDPNFSWNTPYNEYTPNGPSPYTPSSHRPSLDAGSMTHATTVPSSFEASLTPNDQDPLFTDNFDWSNMDTNQDFTSYNIQLMTPGEDIHKHPMEGFVRNLSTSLDQVSSLSPGAQGNAMLYSPYSQNEGPLDEGYEDFPGEMGKPCGDFPLYDSAHGSSSISSTGNACLFPNIGPGAWTAQNSGHPQPFNMATFMEVDE